MKAQDQDQDQDQAQDQDQDQDQAQAQDQNNKQTFIFATNTLQCSEYYSIIIIIYMTPLLGGSKRRGRF